MHSATRNTATVASVYASQVPLPASAQTNGIVAAGVVVGAIVEIDCARVSSGESASRRKPYSATGGFSDSVRPRESVSRGTSNFPGAAMPYNTDAPVIAQALSESAINRFRPAASADHLRDKNRYSYAVILSLTAQDQRYIFSRNVVNLFGSIRSAPWGGTTCFW